MIKLGPYELNQIYTGDARVLAKEIPDKAAKLCFCDPPYWVGYRYGNGKTDEQMEYIDPAWLVEQSRRLASVALITPGIINAFDYPKPDWIYGWFKPGSTRRSMVLNGFNTWEPILVYGQPSKRVYQDSSYLPTVSNLNDKGANFHGCPKPLNLMIELIERFTAIGDIVIDLVVGSGTTAIACKMLGRNYLAFEIDPATADKARQRVAMTQPPLFVVQPEQLPLIEA
jgi:DNA modification methylase